MTVGTWWTPTACRRPPRRTRTAPTPFSQAARRRLHQVGRRTVPSPARQTGRRTPPGTPPPASSTGRPPPKERTSAVASSSINAAPSARRRPQSGEGDTEGTLLRRESVRLSTRTPRQGRHRHRDATDKDGSTQRAPRRRRLLRQVVKDGVLRHRQTGDPTISLDNASSRSPQTEKNPHQGAT